MRCWCGNLSGVRCRLFAYGPANTHCHQKFHHVLPLLKSRLFLPFLYQLTQVVLEKRPLNGCSSHSSSSNSSCCCFSSSSTRHSFDVIKIHYLQIFVLKIKLMHITNTLLVTTNIFLDWVCLQQFSVNFIALFCQL